MVEDISRFFAKSFYVLLTSLYAYLIKNRLNVKGDCYTFFKVSLSSTPNLAENKEYEVAEKKQKKMWQERGIPPS